MLVKQYILEGFYYYCYSIKIQYCYSIKIMSLNNNEKEKLLFIYVIVSHQLSDKRRDRLLLRSDGERTQRVEGYWWQWIDSSHLFLRGECNKGNGAVPRLWTWSSWTLPIISTPAVQGCLGVWYTVCSGSIYPLPICLVLMFQPSHYWEGEHDDLRGSWFHIGMHVDTFKIRIRIRIVFILHMLLIDFN